tara:strand:- start:745 stop:2469 length:1725 start_codon:yes stop_codon:yes gene_type:complete
MNGKNLRTKGCYSRGLGRFKKHTTRTTARQPLYNLPVFNTSLKNNLTSKQLSVTSYFEKFKYIEKTEEYSYKGNTPGAIIKLRQNNFTNGTVRITTPGIYILEEDIHFEPNSGNDFMPTRAQIFTGQYPVGNNGAYHLGFFAAITIETTGVILDLNGKTITQTLLHNLQQRFYAHIELASAPFIPKQGPGEFSTDTSFKSGKYVLIKNGTLGLSSHHGIHGNGMEGVILQNLLVTHFEVAGIALNGATDCILDKITIKESSLDVKVLSSYSQARFIRSFLKRVQTANPKAHLGDKPIDKIIKELNDGLLEAKKYVKRGQIPSNMFGNIRANKGYDGNVYGLVLNVNGVVINGFITKRPTTAMGNQNIYLHNIHIEKIISSPVEIIALNAAPSDGTAYAGSRQAGPVGDVLDIKKITGVAGKYTGNILSDAQLIIAKYNYPKMGTTNITNQIVEWCEGDEDIVDVMKKHNYYNVTGGDSMGHKMKGNIGLFISAGKNINVNKLSINNVISLGQNVGRNTLDNSHQGGDSYGVIVTGSSNISLNNHIIKNITTQNMNATHKKIEIMGESVNISTGP